MFAFLVEHGVVSVDILRRVEALIEPAVPLMRPPPDEEEKGESKDRHGVDEWRAGLASLGPGSGALR